MDLPVDGHTLSHIGTSQLGSNLSVLHCCVQKYHVVYSTEYKRMTLPVGLRCLRTRELGEFTNLTIECTQLEAQRLPCRGSHNR